MSGATEGLLAEYFEVNRHLRANITQFVNWFSFFLAASFAGFGIFVSFLDRWPRLGGLGLQNTAILVAMLMHALACGAILTFRHYIAASDARLVAIIRQGGAGGASPIPTRFCKWMTDLMGAAYLVSYFTWFSLFFVR